MAVGLPVVAPRVGSIAESVQEGEIGRLVPVRDAAAAAAAWLALLGDRERAVRNGTARSRTGRRPQFAGRHGSRLSTVPHRNLRTEGEPRRRLSVDGQRRCTRWRRLSSVRSRLQPSSSAMNVTIPVLAFLAKLLSRATIRWVDCQPDTCQRSFISPTTPVISTPWCCGVRCRREVRELTRPVARTTGRRGRSAGTSPTRSTPS